jgi:hypothetical protein
MHLRSYLQQLLPSVFVAWNISGELGMNVQPIGDLVEDAGVIQVNDKKLVSTLRVKLKFSDVHNMEH